LRIGEIKAVYGAAHTGRKVAAAVIRIGIRHFVASGIN
jgi:hypothetical protein